jgi:alpha-1,6-mannosyltransferase
VVLSPAVHAWYLLWALPFLAAVRWSRPVQQLVLVAALGLGVVAPLESSMLALRAELVVLVGLVALTWVRLRRSVAPAVPARR